MLELKITVETAKDLNQEIKDLYKAIVGSSIDKADAIDQATVSYTHLTLPTIYSV